MRKRIAFIDYFCPHYRRPLFEEIARRMEADFYFFADARERHWNSQIPIVEHGDFRRVELKRVRFADEAMMPGLPMRISRYRYDAVIKNLNGRLMFPSLYLTARARHVPFVLWTGMWYHPETPFHQATKRLTEWVYRDVGAIVAYGDHVKRFLAESPGVDPDKIYVAGQAVEPDRFRAVRPSRNGTEPEILFIGQFEERKGLDDLFDAFESLGDVPRRLRIIGNGSQEEQVRARAARDERIEVIGHVRQDDLPKELVRARCLVLPSVTTDIDKEPWGLVVNEAMHAGVPVVASDAVGAAAGGLVQDERNGFIVPERDPGALADALRSLLTDAEGAERMGAAAAEDVEAFNYTRMADAFEAAVEHSIAARRR